MVHSKGGQIGPTLDVGINSWVPPCPSSLPTLELALIVIEPQSRRWSTHVLWSISTYSTFYLMYLSVARDALCMTRKHWPETYCRQPMCSRYDFARCVAICTAHMIICSGATTFVSCFSFSDERQSVFLLQGINSNNITALIRLAESPSRLARHVCSAQASRPSSPPNVTYHLK